MAIEPVAIFLGDMHLSEKRPRCWSPEVNWVEVQRNYLIQLLQMSMKGQRYVDTGKPLAVFSAGDLFDRWNTSPEIVNLAISHLPKRFATVAGQHDLPYHSLDNVEKSAFGTVLLSNSASLLKPTVPVQLQMKGCVAHVYGYSWKQLDAQTEANKLPSKKKGHFNIAVVHKYIWTDGASYPGADVKARIEWIAELYKDRFHFMVFGDNHKSMVYEENDIVIVNHGTFIRRKTDEIDNTPFATILYEDGTYQFERFITGNDVFVSNKELITRNHDTEVSIDELVKEMKEHGRNLDFVSAVRRVVDSNREIGNKIKKLIYDILEEVESHDAVV